MVRRRWRAFLAGAVLIAWVGVLPAAGQAARVGQPAPEIAGGPWINGAALTLQSLRGRVVLVEFWTYG